MAIYTPTLDEILDGRELTSAEKRLLASCKTGEFAYFGDAVPDAPTDENSIDAALIRYLLLGGCDENPVSPIGVSVVGAYISGVLNFEGCETRLALFCAFCKFSDEPNFMDAEIGQLNLHGCHVPGFNGHRMRVKRDVLMNGEFKAGGTVNLSSADIGGQLGCADSEFDGAGKKALNCDAMQVGADVFLRDGFKAIGQVNFVGVNIKGNLQCEDLSIKGDFIAWKVCVGTAFTWRSVAGEKNIISLMDAQVGVLADDVESWGHAEHLFLKGFTYGALDNQVSDFPLQKRLEWVGRSFCVEHEQPEGNEEIVVIGADKERFEPQPYVQLAKVYEAGGQRGAAARVRREMERRLRRSDYVATRFADDASWGGIGRSLLAIARMPIDGFFGKVFGYGHAPMRGVGYAVGLICLTSWFYGTVYESGQFAPNSDVILTSADWRAFADDETVANPAAAWSADKAGTDYESFSAIGYGIDLFLPLDALGQEGAWAPSKDRGTLGAWGFYLRWVVQFLGWVFTGVLAAALTGIIGRKE